MWPESDAPAVRVTRGGGYTALESADGRMLYYSKPSPGQRWSIWKVPAGSGEETMLIPAIGTQGDFEVTETGIYLLGLLFLDLEEAPHPTLTPLRRGEGTSA